MPRRKRWRSWLCHLSVAAAVAHRFSETKARATLRLASSGLPFAGRSGHPCGARLFWRSAGRFVAVRPAFGTLTRCLCRGSPARAAIGQGGAVSEMRARTRLAAVSTALPQSSSLHDPDPRFRRAGDALPRRGLVGGRLLFPWQNTAGIHPSSGKGQYAQPPALASLSGSWIISIFSKTFVQAHEGQSRVGAMLHGSMPSRISWRVQLANA